MIRVAFVIRDDGLAKGGGDVDLARKYCAMVSALDGIESHVVQFKHLALDRCELVVLFNIDRPFENYLVARECVRRRIPYVIYSLHHKSASVGEFLRCGTNGIQRGLAFASGYNSFAYETIIGFIRLIMAADFVGLMRYRRMSTSARYILQKAASVLISCRDEATQISRDFGTIPAHFEIVAHSFKDGTTSSVPLDAKQARSDNGNQYILCAGRIEPRKNQLTVAHLAKLNPDLHFVFIGRANEKHASYISQFKRAISEAGNIEWRDHVSLSDLRRAIASARVYINLSWFEVFSLIDLMAIDAARPCLLSKGSYLFDLLSSRNPIRSLVFLTPNDVSGATMAMRTLWDSTTLPASPISDDDWSDEVIRLSWKDIIFRECGHAQR